MGSSSRLRSEAIGDRTRHPERGSVKAGAERAINIIRDASSSFVVLAEYSIRVQAIIVNPEGVYLPGTFFAHFFKDFDKVVRQYQIIQDEEGLISLKIVKAEDYDAEEFERMITNLRVHLGDDTSIKIEFTDHIPMVRTGKQQGSISKLKIDFQTRSSIRREQEKSVEKGDSST